MKKTTLACCIVAIIFLPICVRADPMLLVMPTDFYDFYDGTQTSFAFDGSGSISVFWGDPSGADPARVPIYLANTAGDTATFNGIDLDTALITKVDGYPYAEPGVQAYMHSLGPFSTADGSGWTEVMGGKLAEGGKNYWEYSGTFDSGSAGFGIGDWLFAMADTDEIRGVEEVGGVFENGGDKFSPKTTSTTGTSTAVPEPATLLLLGAGLAGLGLVGRKTQV